MASDADNEDARRRLRWSVYALLIAVAVGNMSGRLLAVNSVDRVRLEQHRIEQQLAEDRQRYTAEGLVGDALDERLAEREAELEQRLRLQRPFLSSNDRSRWLTVRSLVEHGTYEIDLLIGEPGWDTIDMVQHRGRDGQLHLYSSKPPLLATLLAAPYWLIHRLTGATLGTHPYEIGRLMLFFINILPLAVLFVLVARLAERYGQTDWGRLFVVACATLGTFLNTFAVVLNNHILAAVSAAVTLYLFSLLYCDGRRHPGLFVLAGLAAAFTVACELPALSYAVFVGLALAYKAPRQTVAYFMPAAVVIVVAFFATNYLAHASLVPPYAHHAAEGEDNWYKFTYTVNGRERQSYWFDPKGIDRGEAHRGWYTLHSLVGHHGILSLSPIWFVSVVGTVLWLRSDDWRRRDLAMLAAAVTVVCLVFYLGLRPQGQRNYGGMTSGFRWMFWCAPLWLMVMLPAADRIARSRAGQAGALVLLAFSVLSASYPTWNPWTHPWLFNWLEYSGLQLVP